MILDSKRIAKLGLVINARPAAQRETTYDATVGDIILEGSPINESEYRLSKRGLIWVVSQEEFHLPSNVTGLATLRTTWTHNGVLALNVGVIDPNWSGPLATAIMNFSDKDFVIKKGEPFFRVIFHRHAHTNARPVVKPRDVYVREISDKSARFPTTFLNLASLADEVLDRIFTFPRWVNRLAVAGIVFAIVSMLVTLIAVFVPTAYGITTDYIFEKNRIQDLNTEITHANRDIATDRKLIEQMSGAIRTLQQERQQPTAPRKPRI